MLLKSVGRLSQLLCLVWLRTVLLHSVTVVQSQSTTASFGHGRFFYEASLNSGGGSYRTSQTLFYVGRAVRISNGGRCIESSNHTDFTTLTTTTTTTTTLVSSSKRNILPRRIPSCGSFPPLVASLHRPPVEPSPSHAPKRAPWRYPSLRMEISPKRTHSTSHSAYENPAAIYGTLSLVQSRVGWRDLALPMV